MNNLLAFSAGLLLVFVVSETSAHCCGRGAHYFCSDCSVVTHKLSLHGRKCCHSGNKYYHGCNIFCCNCHSCTKGRSKVNYVSGYWTKKTYKCQVVQKYDEGQDNELDDETEKAFSKLDEDGDRNINPDEFLKGLKSHLQMDTGDLVASELLDTDNIDEVADFADAINSNDINEEALSDFEEMAHMEFKAMDANGDGLIQAKEFDKDLHEQS